ncbi:MAG TPA: alcohol dehydrogenase catalytic domain-containing protein [Geobacterales bacterium]|nr:alcohol dehydrogenase catalytic domain-containing protein [Geobacterales bacterium]
MKAAVLKNIRELKIEEKEIPVPSKGELVIRLLYALTCGTDLKSYERGHPFLKFPRIIGHEYVGEVVAKGDLVKNFEIGDLVTGANSAPCGECFYCRKGNHNLCERLNETLLGFTLDGAFAQYMKVPRRIVEKNLYKIEERDYKKYASIEPLACVVHSWKFIDVKGDDNILIIGSGPIAILHSQLALNYSKNVSLLGKHDNRLSLARRLGIKVYDYEIYKQRLDELKEGFDIVIEAVGTPEAWGMAFDLVRKGGSLLYFGGLKSGTQVSFDAYKIHYGELQIYGSFHHDPVSVRRAFELIKENKVDTKILITSERNLEEIESALLDMASGKDMKVGIKF